MFNHYVTDVSKTSSDQGVWSRFLKIPACSRVKI